MLQALERGPWVLGYATDEIRSDFELSLIAFAGSRADVQELIEMPGMRYTDNIVPVRRRARELLDLHQQFFATFLLGTSSVGPGSTLSVMNQGEETSRNYKMAIAEYLGVPTGIKLRRLRKSEENLTAILDRL